MGAVYGWQTKPRLWTRQAGQDSRPGASRGASCLLISLRKVPTVNNCFGCDKTLSTTGNATRDFVCGRCKRHYCLECAANYNQNQSGLAGIHKQECPGCGGSLALAGAEFAEGGWGSTIAGGVILGIFVGAIVGATTHNAVGFWASFLGCVALACYVKKM